MFANPLSEALTIEAIRSSFVPHYLEDGKTVKPFDQYKAEIVKEIDNRLLQLKFDIREKNTVKDLGRTAENKFALGVNSLLCFPPKIFDSSANFIASGIYIFTELTYKCFNVNPIFIWQKFFSYKNYQGVNYSKFNSDGVLKDPYIYEYDLKNVADKFYYDHKVLSERQIYSNITFAVMNSLETVKDISNVLKYSLSFNVHFAKFVSHLFTDWYKAYEDIGDCFYDIIWTGTSLFMVGLDSLATGAYLVFGVRDGLNNVLSLVSSGFKMTADLTNFIGKGFGYLTSYIGEDAAKAVEKLFEMSSNIFLVTDASLKFAYHLCSLQWRSAINDAYDFVSHIFQIPTDGISAVYHTFSQIYKAIEYVVQPIYPVGSYVLELGKDIILYVVDKTIEYLTPVIETANEYIKYFKDILNENYTHLSDNVGNFTKDAINSLTELKAIYANNLSNWLDELKAGVSDNISKFRDNFQDYAENAYKWMWSFKSNSGTQPDSPPQEEYISDEIVVADESSIKNSFINIIEKLKSAFSLDSIYKLFDINIQNIENIQEDYNIPEREIYIENSPEKLALFKQKSYINVAKDLKVSVTKNLNNIKEDSKDYFSKWWNKEAKILEQQPEQHADSIEELNYDNIEIAKNIILPQEEIAIVSYYDKLPSLKINLPNLQEIIVNPIYEWWHKNDAQVILDSNINNEEYEIIPTEELIIAGDSDSNLI